MTNRSNARRHSLPVRRAVVSLGVVIAVGAVVTPSALASPGTRPGPAATKSLSGQPGSGHIPARWARVYAAQERLDAAAARILAAADPGNPSIVVDPFHPEVRVYWHGRVPAPVRALAARLGVRLLFRPARYTLAALVAATKRLFADPRVNLAAPRADGSGLDVTITRRTLAPGQRDLLASSRIPLTITVGPPAQPLAGYAPVQPGTPRLLPQPQTRRPLTYNRQQDAPPYWGGSAYSTAGTMCSNGFSLSLPGHSNNYELTAGHCGANGAAVSIPSQPNPTGSFQNKLECHDITQINYTANVVGGYIYTGGPNSWTYAKVVGAAQDMVGDLVITGGARTDEHDGLQVTNLNEYIPARGTTPCPPHGSIPSAWGPFTIATLSGECAAAPGDSGGPVYTYSTGSTTTAIGRGTISIGRNPISGKCVDATGQIIDGYSTVLYPPLLDASNLGSLQLYGATLLSG